MSAPSPRPLWGWGLPAQGLLTILAALGALALVARSQTLATPAVPVPELIVDPNTAPFEVLLALPKMGPSVVRGIITARSQAPFRTLQDLDDRVPRIGPATIAALRPHLKIEPIRSQRPETGPSLALQAGPHSP